MALRSDDWTRVRELFERALALPGSERAAYLADACGTDQTLRDEVARMLDSHDGAAGFLSTPAAVTFDPVATTSLEGQRIGPYQLGARIGAGGMGEVYKARDTRLDRTVAIKVLPPDVVHDTQARERFVREGRAIAALNHPNICALYDVGDTAGGDSPAAGSTLFLVMEHLEGETLADRLARGPMPALQALKVGAQIASALDRAHRAGIVHRDLKPGNIFLVRSGASGAPTAKLLDFGLAKALAPPPAETAATRHAIAASLTVPGMIIGTVQYMAPEQVEGRDADARTDVFAFGAVLHEMLTGAKAFAGKSQASLTVAILEHDPAPVSTLVPSAPAALDRVVRKCLAKSPDDRWQSAADLASELDWIAQGGAVAQVLHGGHRPARLAWAIAALAAIAAVAAVLVLPQRGLTLVPPTTKRFIIELPTSTNANAPSPVLAPDGSALVYASGGGGRFDWQLVLFTMSNGQSRVLPKTDGASNVFFSPDGKRVGFVQGGRIRTMAVAGGPPEDFCDVPVTGGGASWGADDWIVANGPGGLLRISQPGCHQERLTTLAPGELRHIYPHVVTGKDAVLFTVLSTSGAEKDAAVSAVSIRTGERRVLVKGASSAHYAPTGHLLYVRGGDLMAVPFDGDRLTTNGSPVVAVSKLQVTPQSLEARFDLSADGTLIYVPGDSSLERTLVWSDRNGTLRPAPVPPRPYAHPVLLPNGQGMILEIEGTPHNLWRYDSISGAMMLLTHEGANHRAVLSPDGQVMAYSSDRTATRSLFRQATDGSGRSEPIMEAPYPQDVTSWSRDGKWLAFTQRNPQTGADIWVLPLTGDRKARAFLATPFTEQTAAFSRDGRWLAYGSDESGREEVVVAAFPGPGPRKQVSTNGGGLPLFSADGQTLFYRQGDRIMAASFMGDPALTIGAPRVAFEIPGAQRIAAMPFPVTPDGQSVLYVKEPSERASPTIHVVVNWFEELRRLTAAP